MEVTIDVLKVAHGAMYQRESGDFISFVVGLSSKKPKKITPIPVCGTWEDAIDFIETIDSSVNPTIFTISCFKIYHELPSEESFRKLELQLHLISIFERKIVNIDTPSPEVEHEIEAYFGSHPEMR